MLSIVFVVFPMAEDTRTGARSICDKAILRAFRILSPFWTEDPPNFKTIIISLFPLRRDTKFSEHVRLVQIGGDSLVSSDSKRLKQSALELKDDLNLSVNSLIDLAACGGIHTKTTGEVGLIKYKGQEKVRGRLRLFWLIGKRAYSDYRIKSDITDELGEALSIPLTGIKDEFNRLVSTLNDEKKKNNDLLMELVDIKYKEIIELSRQGEYSILLENVDPSFFKKIIISLSSVSNITVCLINRIGNEGQWAIISTEKDKIDFDAFRNNLLPVIEGKGGGKAPLWQGKMGSSLLLDKFREQFSQLLT